MRIKEIYDITKKEIYEGQNIYEYIHIMYGLLKEEDYEALEGIKLALLELGIKFKIPDNDDEMDMYNNLI